MANMAEMIQTMRGLVPWPVMRAFLRRKDLPSSRGWEELVDKLNELAPTAQETAERELKSFLTEYHLHGEKWVSFLEVPEHFKDLLADYLSTLSPQSGAAAAAYPFRLSDAVLAEQEENILQLVHVSVSASEVVLVFSGIVTIESKDTIYPDQFTSSGVPAAFNDYEEIVLVRRKPNQCFPVIVFRREEGWVQALVPSLGNYGAEDVLLSNLTRSVNEMLVRNFGLDLQLSRYRNLFPVIHNIYERADEGTVVELGFQTETGSAKLERMKQHDLRQEPFHAKGKEAVFNSLLEFRLAVRWGVGEHDVEMLLPGTTRTIAKSPPYALYRARVSGTVDRAEFQECIGKLLQYSTS